MLVLYLFNLVGYPLLFDHLMDKANQKLVAKLDAVDFEESGLIEIKLPMQLPYSLGKNSYERFDGQLEWKGVVYNYVKRKITSDTLYLLCLPNEQGTKLLTAQKQYGKQLIDLPGDKKGKEPAEKKGSQSTQYKNIELNYAIFVFSVPVKQKCFYKTPSLPELLIAKQEQPPDSLLSIANC